MSFTKNCQVCLLSMFGNWCTQNIMSRLSAASIRNILHSKNTVKTVSCWCLVHLSFNKYNQDNLQAIVGERNMSINKYCQDCLLSTFPLHQSKSEYAALIVIGVGWWCSPDLSTLLPFAVVVAIKCWEQYFHKSYTILLTGWKRKRVGAN